MILSILLNSAKLVNLSPNFTNLTNFQSYEVVDRGKETQLHLNDRKFQLDNIRDLGFEV